MEITVESQIRRVVVHARGALVTRTISEVDEPGEDVDLVLCGITPLAEPGSVRAVVSAPRSIVSVRAALEIPAAPLETGPSVQKVEALQAEIDRLERERQLLTQRSAHLGALNIDPGIAARSRQELVRERTIDAMAAARVFDEIAERCDARIAAIEASLRQLRLEREAAALADGQASSAERMGEQHARRKIVTRLGGTGRVQGLEVTYAVKAARWWPLYTLRLSGDRAASWWIEALVAQESGEDWSNVELALSTGEMIFDARLPELPSLRLGKARTPKRSSYRLPPSGLDTMFSGYDRVFQSMTVATSSTTVVQAGRAEPLSYDRELTAEEELDSFDGAPADALQAVPELARAQMAPAMMAPMASMPQSMPMNAPRRRAEMSKKGGPPPPAKAMVFGGPPGARGGGGAAARDAPMEPLPLDPLDPGEAWLDFDRLRLGAPSEIRVRGRLHVEVDLAIHFASSAERHLESIEAGLRVRDPRESRGNFDHRYNCSARADVPSDGIPHRLKVDAGEAVPRFLWTTVPREAPEVHREAELSNPFSGPLLEGPVDVYSEGSFLTTAWIDSIDRGGTLRVGMGVEERIRVARNVRFQEETTGLLGGNIEVTHDVSIELSSGMTTPVTVEIRDRMPVSDDKTLEVKLLKESASSLPLKQGDSETPLRGGLRWTLRLEPQSQGRIDYTYRMSFPSKSEIVGGNRRES